MPRSICPFSTARPAARCRGRNRLAEEGAVVVLVADVGLEREIGDILLWGRRYRVGRGRGLGWYGWDARAAIPPALLLSFSP